MTFPDALDHGLLRRALGIAKAGESGMVSGEAVIEAARPAGSSRRATTGPWVSYELVAFAFLEDLAGNRVGRAFEVDNFERTDLTPEPERRTLPFTIER